MLAYHHRFMTVFITLDSGEQTDELKMHNGLKPECLKATCGMPSAAQWHHVLCLIPLSANKLLFIKYFNIWQKAKFLKGFPLYPVMLIVLLCLNDWSPTSVPGCPGISKDALPENINFHFIGQKIIYLWQIMHLCPFIYGSVRSWKRDLETTFCEMAEHMSLTWVFVPILFGGVPWDFSNSKYVSWLNKGRQLLL